MYSRCRQCKQAAQYDIVSQIGALSFGKLLPELSFADQYTCEKNAGDHKNPHRCANHNGLPEEQAQHRGGNCHAQMIHYQIFDGSKRLFNYVSNAHERQNVKNQMKNASVQITAREQTPKLMSDKKNIMAYTAIVKQATASDKENPKPVAAYQDIDEKGQNG